MSRFKALASKDIAKTTEVAFARRSLADEIETFDSPTYTGPLTESSYSTYKVQCSAPTCKGRLLSIINPEYNLTVGYHSSFPYEILFTERPTTIVNKAQGFWSSHAIATDKSRCFTCPECGTETLFALCIDGGILISQDCYTEEMRPIPKNRVRFLTTPRKEWSTQDVR